MMELYSLAFVLFLLAALAIYYLVGRVSERYQWIVLLIVSLAYYCINGADNILFIVCTAVVTWGSGICFAKINEQYQIARNGFAGDKEARKKLKAYYQKKKRIILIITLLITFGILGYLKYWNEIIRMFRIRSLEPFKSHLLLPLGISFYTFQSVGYVIDAYNGKYKPETNFARFLLFVSFFPQLIQGPINRFDAMAKQLYAAHHMDYEKCRRALLIIGFGIIKKYAIADPLSGTIARIFDHTDPNVPGSMVVFGILLYSVQQYTDFSGGIDMVLGVAELFGIQMAPNFRQPYFSVSLADFWRRWHITLGQWMRDYVFYPFALTAPMQRLGKWSGKHLGKHLGRTLPACIANLLVFLIVGLWHGAESHNILWGLYNGIVIAASDLMSPGFDFLTVKLRIHPESKAFHLFRIIRTFIIVNIGWYFDRIKEFHYCLICFRNTIMNFDAGRFGEVLASYQMDYTKKPYMIAAVGCVLVFAVSVLKEKNVDVESCILAMHPLKRSALYVAAALLVLWAFVFTAPSGGFMYAVF